MKQANLKIRNYLFVVIAMICWSFSFIWTSVALESFPPLTLISLRLVFASLILFIILLLSDKLIIPKRDDLKLFLALAFFEPFLYYIGETYGLTMVSPTLASVIIATIPIFAPFFAFAILKERFTSLNLLGIAVSLFGVFLIVNKTNNTGSTSAAGIMLVFLAVLSAVIYGLILRKIPVKFSAANIVLYQNLFGLLYFIPTTLFTDYSKYDGITIHQESLKALLLLTIFASIIAFVLFSDVVRRIGLTKSQVFTNLIPVFTALFSWIFLEELLSTLQWFGIFVVVLGVFVSQSGIKLRKKSSKQNI